MGIEAEIDGADNVRVIISDEDSRDNGWIDINLSPEQAVEFGQSLARMGKALIDKQPLARPTA